MTEKPLKKAAAPIQNQPKQKNITLILNEILDPESIQFEFSEHENQHILAPNENLSEQEKHAKKMRELELQQKYLVMKYQQNEEQRRQIAHQNEEQRRQIAHENEEQRKQERHALEMAQYITCTEILSFMWGLVWPSTSAKNSLRRSSRELYLDKRDNLYPQLKKVQ
ncbi:hypothetical protein C9374_009350 [Naegleria lovaniensis]|uniref:Uncharacterized protein n=1 Tax=Naegleria lovaniensis TaxID=51637 RepID=A0AA88GDJ8_NAELO|nr:uncharacterized protein C9374_009350 [Naegleria lovaniensis]KAG2377439.1 hypothetical protein C9374_009350 [Naegleria lovaniensis]